MGDQGSAAVLRFDGVGGGREGPEELGEGEVLGVAPVRQGERKTEFQLKHEKDP